MLAEMADDGVEAADAMTQLLMHPASHPYFPRQDAIVELKLVQIHGTDLRRHQCVGVLSSLAASDPDPLIRKSAKDALVAIAASHSGRLR
jgi:hypothetical protein